MTLSTRYIWSALKLWRARRLQALLSMLGVVAGVSGLVMVIALGEGANEELQSALGTLGTGSVIIRNSAPEGTDGVLTSEKVRSIQRLIPSLSRYTQLQVSQTSALAGATRLDNVKIIGTDRAYQSIYKLALHAGRFLTDHDLRGKEQLCVLGWQAGKILFPRGQVIGQQVRIDGQWYRVVGWLKPITFKMPKLEGLDLSELDQVIYLPITALSGRNDRFPLDELILQFQDEAQMTAAMDVVKRVLSATNNEALVEYVIPIQLLRQKQKLQQVFQYLLLGIAALMLTVGGIGIMNMMMVNVVSRRPEIGLRRAMGATRQDIIAQFVTESLVISVVGGLAGTILGIAISTLIDLGTEWPMAFNGAAAVMGFFVSIAIGVIFGSYPAVQAAAVSPVQSLNEL